MENSRTSLCIRCRADIQPDDKFCQECGMQLSTAGKKKRGYEQTGSAVLDFRPPGQDHRQPVQELFDLDMSPKSPAPESEPDTTAAPRQQAPRLHSPLLDNDVIDCSPSAIPAQLLPDPPKVQRPGAALVEFHPRRERDQLRSRSINPPDTDQSAATAATAGSGAVAVAEVQKTQPRLREYAVLLSQHAESRANRPIPGIPGPLKDLFQASIVLLTLTAIATYFGVHLSKNCLQQRKIATKQLNDLVHEGKLSQASAKAEAIRQATGGLDQRQSELLNEARYQQATDSLEKGQLAKAQSLLSQIEPSSARFSKSREILVFLNTPDHQIWRPESPRPTTHRERAKRRALSDKENLSLPELPEPVSLSTEATTTPVGDQPSAGEPENQTVADAPSGDQAPKPAAEAPAAKPKCSERDIARYNRMLATWILHNKVDAKQTQKVSPANSSGRVQSEQTSAITGESDKNTSPIDPPSFREWLQQGKPKF